MKSMACFAQTWANSGSDALLVIDGADFTESLNVTFEVKCDSNGCEMVGVVPRQTSALTGNREIHFRDRGKGTYYLMAISDIRLLTRVD